MGLRIVRALTGETQTGAAAEMLVPVRFLIDGDGCEEAVGGGHDHAGRERLYGEPPLDLTMTAVLQALCSRPAALSFSALSPQIADLVSFDSIGCCYRFSVRKGFSFTAMVVGTSRPYLPCLVTRRTHAGEAGRD